MQDITLRILGAYLVPMQDNRAYNGTAGSKVHRPVPLFYLTFHDYLVGLSSTTRDQVGPERRSALM